MRIAGVDCQIDCSDVVGKLFAGQDLRPVCAAVRGAKDAAIGIGLVDVAESRNIDAIRIGGIDDDAADLARVFETDVGPGFARVGGFEDADAVRMLAADVRLAGADNRG